MNKTYKYTLNSGEKKEITFGVGVNRLAISNANGYDGDVTIVTREITKTKSGDIVSFDDGADAPFADLKVNIEAVQSGSGDPSPTNVRPISGFNAVNVGDISDTEKVQYFKGLLDGTYGFLDLGSLSWTIDERFANNQFYCSLPSSMKTNSVLLCSKPYLYNSSTTWGSNVNETIGIVSNAYLLIVDNSYASASDFETAMNGVYLIYELATPTTPTITPTEFNTLVFAFGLQGWLVQITMPTEAGTVYGGTLDVLNGTLKVTHANIASYDGETINEPWMSSMDVYVAGATPTTGAQVVYPLTTPVTYQLTPTEVRSLLGINNVWADCGSISLKYFVQSTQPLIDYINDEDDRCVYIDCTQSGADTFSITSDITKAEFVSLLNKNKNVKLRLDTGSGDVIFDLSYVTANIADFTCNRTALISDVNSFQSLTLRVDMSGDTLSLSRHAVITIGDGTYEYIAGQNNQLIKDGWSWSTQGYDLRDADELLFMITPMPNVASDSDTINGEMQRSSQDPKRALFCKGIKNMLPEVQEIESPFWFNDIVVVGNRAIYTSKNDITMKIRVWANYYSSPQHSLADVNFYANCDCNDSTANLWGMCNVFVFKKKR